jgi:uncharacterized protein (TIGR03067 family)
MRCISFVAMLAAVMVAPAGAAEKSSPTPPELRGTWVFYHADAGGKAAAPTREVKRSRVQFDDGKFVETWTDADGRTQRSESRFEIDAEKSPQQITLYTKCETCTADGQPTDWTMPGIYRVDGDVLNHCMGVVRPTQFDSPCSVLIVLKKLPEPEPTQTFRPIHRRRPRVLIAHLGQRFRFRR